MRATEIPNLPDEVLAVMDQYLLDHNGRQHLLPASKLLEAAPWSWLMAWMVRRARYQFVTLELVAWLKEKIAGRSAIEIGAGMGDLGYHLGIPMTDSYAQAPGGMPVEYQLLVEISGQTPTTPPPDVERLEAEEAVKKYKPQVVIASWVTQKWHEGDARGFQYGPEEIRIVRNVEAYILVGNSSVHGDKRICRLKHKEYSFDWLVSRGFEQEKNKIYVWGT